MGGRKDIYKDAKGFDKNPENINRKGRPKKLISHINTELKNEGYTPAKVDEIKQAFLTLVNLPISKIQEMSNKNNDNFPMLYNLVAKEMLGKRGLEMMEKVLDRAIGKPQNFIDHTSKGNEINITVKPPTIGEH